MEQIDVFLVDTENSLAAEPKIVILQKCAKLVEVQALLELCLSLST